MSVRYITDRDISFFRHINRELISDIITQQCAFYKISIKETKTNIYGEAAEEKFYKGPVLLNCLIERGDQEHSESESGVEYSRTITFKFLRDDLLQKNIDINTNTPFGADLRPEVGDIIFYQEGYYELNRVINNQLISGKNPDYPNNPNPLAIKLEEYGANLSIICETHYVPSDKVGIERSRYL